MYNRICSNHIKGKKETLYRQLLSNSKGTKGDHAKDFIKSFITHIHVAM